MVNEEQLTILKKGPEDWNKWRKDNSEIKMDLRLNRVLSYLLESLPGFS